MTQPDVGPVWEPIAPASAPVGMMAPVHIQSNRDNLAKLSAIAATLLNDPLQLQQLTERVYQLMQANLHLQHERRGGYGGRR